MTTLLDVLLSGPGPSPDRERIEGQGCVDLSIWSGTLNSQVHTCCIIYPLYVNKQTLLDFPGLCDDLLNMTFCSTSLLVSAFPSTDF